MLSQSFQQAFDTFKLHMVPWCIFGIVLVFAGTLIPIIGGFLLLPNALRETKKSILEQRAPELAGLFDMSHFGDDLVSMCLYTVAQTAGALLCCIGWPVAWILFWYTAELSADNRVSGADAMRASMAYVMENLSSTIAMAVICVVINSAVASVTAGVGVIFTTPIILLAWAYYWLAIQEDVYAIAAQKGIAVSPK